MDSAKSKADRSSAAKVAAADRPPVVGADDESIDALRKENEELRRNSQYRSLFLARLAHELRTPLTSILGFSEIMLSQEKLTEAQRGFCERIQSSAQQLQASLNQLSDLARLEGSQARLSPQQVSIDELLREVCPALARPLEKKRAKLSCTAADDLTKIVSDRSRLRLVIYNLLSYAVSRSPERGTVLVDAAATSASIALTVRDSGDPIEDPERIGILDADDSSSASELGISIAHQNTQLLGGTIIARNLDEGVELILTLPVALPQ